LRNSEMGAQQPGFFICLIVIHSVQSSWEIGRRLRYEV
jgi:hypothetical protein